MGICVFIIPLFKLYICNFHNTETKKFKNKQTKKKTEFRGLTLPGSPVQEAVC